MSKCKSKMKLTIHEKDFQSKRVIIIIPDQNNKKAKYSKHFKEKKTSCFLK